MLSVYIEKTDEAELQMVVEKAAQTLKKADLDLAEFSSYGDLDSRPGHYVIFWELQSRSCAPKGLTQVSYERKPFSFLTVTFLPSISFSE